MGRDPGINQMSLDEYLDFLEEYWSLFPNEGEPSAFITGNLFLL